MIQGLLEKRVNWNIGNFIDTGVQTRGDWALYSKTAPTELKTLLSNEWLLKSLEDSASWQKDRSRIFFFVLHISQSNTIIVHYQHCSTCRVGKKLTMQNKIKIKNLPKKKRKKRQNLTKKILTKTKTKQTNAKKWQGKWLNEKSNQTKCKCCHFTTAFVSKPPSCRMRLHSIFISLMSVRWSKKTQTNSRVAQCWKYSGLHLPVTNGKFK